MIKLTIAILNGIIRQAQNELPNETCGLLAGSGCVVHKQIPMTNTDHSPEHFSFDPSEQFQALRTARSEGLELIANYHSHPETPSRPSVEDIRLAYDPDILYLILSLAGETPVLKAFRIQNGISVEEPVEILG
jgi:[CysO sulfur-carrier protein]-S-L-cysteine hydrolase